MSKPVQIRSKEHFYETLLSYPIVFAMFYICDDLSTKAMLPIYVDLCQENSTPSIAFVKIQKQDFPGLCRKYGVPSITTSLTFVCFRDGQKAELIDGDDSKKLERLVYDHVRKPKKSDPPPEQKKCDCCDEPPDSDADDDRKKKPHKHHKPARIVVAPKHWPHRHHVPPRVQVEAHGLEKHKAHPAEMRHRQQIGPFAIDKPVDLVYKGADGKRHVANDISIQRGANGKPKVHFMDESGPLNVERTVARKKR